MIEWSMVSMADRSKKVILLSIAVSEMNRMLTSILLMNVKNGLETDNSVIKIYLVKNKWLISLKTSYEYQLVTDWFLKFFVNFLLQIIFTVPNGVAIGHFYVLKYKKVESNQTGTSQVSVNSSWITCPKWNSRD